MKEYIRYKHFLKSITSQPFFIWNTLDKKDTKGFEDEEGLENFWNEVSQETDEASYGEIHAKTYSKIDEWIIEWLSKSYDLEIIKGSIEERVERTKELINSNKLLINPAFEYKGAISTLIAFDAKSKTIVEHKYSKTTKLIDGVKAYWNYSIISKTTQVKDIKLLLPVNKNTYKKGELDMHFVAEIHVTKTGKTPGEVGKDGVSKEVSLINFVRNPSSKKYSFQDIDGIIKTIEKAKESDLSIDLIDDDLFGFDKNKELELMLEKFNFKYAGWNGKVVTKDMIKDYFTLGGDENVISSNVSNEINSINSAKIINEDLYEIVEIDKAHKVIWYDFEGYSLPFSPVDGISPFSQVVFQVSTIETIDGNEVRKENLVIDPKELDHEGFIRIIDEVYSGGADAYVVYNKAYENARIREMVQILESEYHPKAKEMRIKYDEINSKTIDLMDLFKINSGKNLPKILINDQKAKSSIKNIEKHITRNKINVPRPIQQYAQLDVQNGGMAMEIAINRAIGIIGDVEWEAKVKSLKEYCENDVRAMMMVYDFAKMLKDKNDSK